jgi:hypothetical protein
MRIKDNIAFKRLGEVEQKMLGGEEKCSERKEDVA